MTIPSSHQITPIAVTTGETPTPQQNPCSPAPLLVNRISGALKTEALVTARAFRAVATFNRPGDTNAYAQFDAISNSTSAPTTPALAIAGAASGDFIDIRNVRLNTSTKPTGVRLTANVYLGATTFAATNDNAELSIDDTTAESGVWVPLNNSFQSALNYRVSSDPVSMLMQLSSGSVFAAIQANNAWAPGNADKVTLVVEGFLYTA
jgi:hypothetical protein